MELETLLHEIEATINSRPLTFVGDEIQDRKPLTPAHFLIGRGSLFLPEKLNKEETDTYSEDLRNRLVIRNHLLNRFWLIWSKEYIRHLPQCTGSGTTPNLHLGDLVLVQEDNCPRMRWPVGIIEELFPSKDGVVRAVKIRTKSGSINRPIQKIHNLEVDSVADLGKLSNPDSDSSGVDAPVVPTSVEDTSGQSVPVTRSGRKVKPVQKLNL